MKPQELIASARVRLDRADTELSKVRSFLSKAATAIETGILDDKKPSAPAPGWGNGTAPAPAAPAAAQPATTTKKLSGTFHMASKSVPAKSSQWKPPAGRYSRLGMAVTVEVGDMIPNYWQLFYLTKGGTRPRDLFGLLFARGGKVIFRHGFGQRFVEKPKRLLGRFRPERGQQLRVLYECLAGGEINLAVYDEATRTKVLAGSWPSLIGDRVGLEPGEYHIEFDGKTIIHAGFGSTQEHGGIQPGWGWSNLSLNLS